MVLSIVQPSSSPILEQVLSQLKGVRTSMRGWRACCPAHADRKPSLSIGLGEQGQVLLKCFAGCSLERIVEAMGLTITDLFPEETPAPDGQATPSVKTRHPPHPTLTLVDLALEKQLPWKFLFSLGVMEHPSGGLQIPYHLPDGTLAPRHRIRTALVAKEGSHWSPGKGAIVPYGLERLEEARKAGYLVLVEGESDCWTLWYQGFQALGLPGAEMARTLEESMLAGIDRLYLMQEPDAGGTSFVNQIARKLEAWQWSGKAFVLRFRGCQRSQRASSARQARVSRLLPAGVGSGRTALLPQFTIGNVTSPTRSALHFQSPRPVILGIATRALDYSRHICRKD